MEEIDWSKLVTKEDLEKLASKRDIEKLDERIEGVEQRMEMVERRISELDERVNKIDSGVSKLAVMDNKEAIEKCVTREEFDEKIDALARTLDEVLTISRRLDVERVAPNNLGR